MSLTERIRLATAEPLRRATPKSWRKLDVLFVSVMAILVAVHGVIFFATLVIAPETADEVQSLALVHLPLYVARALTLPFDVLLLVSLFTLGDRVAGRWGGMAPVFAALALNLRADPTNIVWGPSMATGGWAAASLFAAAMVVLPTRRRTAAVLIGLAAVANGLAVLMLPGFLIALALFPAPGGPGALNRLRELGRFVGAWAIPFVLGQLLWLSSLGGNGWIARFDTLFAAEFRPHPLVPPAEQAVLLFRMWHFPPLTLASLAFFLFVAATIGIVRYFVVPRPGELVVIGRPDARPPHLLVVLRRFPIEFWAAAVSVGLFSTWWAYSGADTVVAQSLAALVVVIPLVTTMAYKGAKWLITVNRFWRFWAIVYLIGLFAARTIQLLLTLVQAFQR